MKSKAIFKVVVLGAIAIAGIIAVQSYWVLSTWNINQAEFNKKVNLVLYDVAKALAKASDSDLPPHNIVTQKTSNYYIVNIEDEIDPDILEYYLQREFEAKALNIDFEYAVFDCTTDEMVYGNYVSYSLEKTRDIKLSNLPKDHSLTYYFGVKFPTRPNYLWGQMQLSMFFSIILFITLAFFAYSLFVILKQKRLSELQKDFINNMTHEFKTPLSTIKISSNVLLNAEPIQKDERLTRYTNIIKEQQERLNRQVEKVLQLAKVEEEKFDLTCENLNLLQVLQESLASLSVKVEKAGGTLETQIDAANVNIYADRFHLINVLNNLFDNALKYSRENPRINVTCKTFDKEVLLEIEDNGIGINPEYQSKVFNKFYRVPTGNVHNVKGFGLGLYYVKSICNGLNWNLQLNSEEMKGTVIGLTIPIKNKQVK